MRCLFALTELPPSIGWAFLFAALFLLVGILFARSIVHLKNPYAGPYFIVWSIIWMSTLCVLMLNAQEWNTLAPLIMKCREHVRLLLGGILVFGWTLLMRTYTQYVELLKKAAAEKTDPNALLAIARRLIAHRSFPAAETALNRVRVAAEARADSQSLAAQACYLLAACGGMSADFAKAEQWATRAIQLNSQSGEAHVYLVMALLNQGKSAEALQAIDRGRKAALPSQFQPQLDALRIHCERSPHD